MTYTMYHGTSDVLVLHPGLCLTDDWSAAKAYARQYIETGDPTAAIHTVEVDFTGLTVVELEEEWNADDPDAFADPMPGVDYPEGVDILAYTDYALGISQMTTYRLLTDAALAAVRHIAVEEV